MKSLLCFAVVAALMIWHMGRVTARQHAAVESAIRQHTHYLMNSPGMSRHEAEFEARRYIMDAYDKHPEKFRHQVASGY